MKDISKVLKTIFITFILSLGLVCIIATGGGGGGDGDTVGGVAEVSYELSVDAKVVLPNSSPVEINNTNLVVNCKTSSVNTDGKAKITILTNKVIEVTLMLPKRTDDALPTVYLSSTVVPGETGVVVNATETAIGIILDSIDRTYLENVNIATYVKSVVRENSQTFIATFTKMLEQDPYLLRLNDDLEFVRNDVFGSDYVDAVASCMEELESMVAAEIQPLYRINNTTLEIEPSDRVKISPTFSQFGFLLYEETENGIPTHNLTLVNLSQLPSIYKMTDSISGEVIKALPEGFVNTAFSADILSPTSGPFNLRFPYSTTVKSASRNVIIELYTPGTASINYDEYTNSPSPALLARAAYSSAFLPVLSALIPDAIPQTVFSVLKDAGVFDELILKWMNGDISAGLRSGYGNLKLPVVYQIIEQVADRLLLGEANKALLASMIATKFATINICNLVAAGVSVQTLSQALTSVTGKITYLVEYPVGISSLEPVAMKKIKDNEDSPKFVLSGYGLKPFEFDGRVHNPSILIEPFDKDDQLLQHAWLDADNLDIDSRGESIGFYLPRYMSKIDTDIAYVSLTLHHAYINADWTGGITNYFNTLQSVDLPLTAEQKHRFTIYLTTGACIKSVEPASIELDQTILFKGEGFASQQSGLENKVYFLDRTNRPIEALINESWDDVISADVPSLLELDYFGIGDALVYVELEDGSQTNKFTVPVIPDRVWASPKGSIDTHTYKGTKVTLKQDDSVQIYYSLNGAPDQQYTGPLTLEKTSTIYAYAKHVIGGADYISRLNKFEYLTCGEGKTFIDYPHGAKCLVIQNQGLIPRRYCPLKASGYSEEIEVEFDSSKPGYVLCSYYMSGALHDEEQYIGKKRATTPIRNQGLLVRIAYWEEPAGRPFSIYRPGGDNDNTVYLNPDGSFFE